MTKIRTSRRELALVACVLLVPIPVFAASGLGIPLPSAVERGLASLLPLPGDQESSQPVAESETAAATVGSTGGPATEGQAAVSDPDVAQPPGADAPRTGTSGVFVETTTQTEGGSNEETDPPAGDDPLPRPDVPTAADDPAVVGPATPLVEVAVTGPGATVDVSLGEDGASVDTGVGEDGVSADVDVEENALDVDVTLPGSGLGIP